MQHVIKTDKRKVVFCFDKKMKKLKVIDTEMCTRTFDYNTILKWIEQINTFLLTKDCRTIVLQCQTFMIAGMVSSDEWMLYAITNGSQDNKSMICTSNGIGAKKQMDKVLTRLYNYLCTCVNETGHEQLQCKKTGLWHNIFNFFHGWR